MLRLWQEKSTTGSADPALGLGCGFGDWGEIERAEEVSVISLPSLIGLPATALQPENVRSKRRKIGRDQGIFMGLPFFP